MYNKETARPCAGANVVGENGGDGGTDSYGIVVRKALRHIIIVIIVIVIIVRLTVPRKTVAPWGGGGKPFRENHKKERKKRINTYLYNRLGTMKVPWVLWLAPTRRY